MRYHDLMRGPRRRGLRAIVHRHGGRYFTYDQHLDQNGVAVPGAKTAYWPYGAPRSGGVTQTDELFTGQKRENQDTVLGLYNYRARFYSTTVGKFISADPMTTDGLNRFAYVRNNPMTYNDPTGLGVTLGGDPREGSCPKTNPDCVNSGPGPVGGPGPDPCDDNCHMLRGIYEYCHGSGARDPSCGGGPAPVHKIYVPPTPAAPEDDDCSGLMCGVGSLFGRAVDKGKDLGKAAAHEVKVMVTDPDCYGVVADAVGFGAGVVADGVVQTPFVLTPPGALVFVGAVYVGRVSFVTGLILDGATGDATGLKLSAASAATGEVPYLGQAVDLAALGYSASQCGR